MAPKVVVITGCSSGIGLETAVLLASDKENRFKVFATMRNLAKKAQLEIAAGSTLQKSLFIRQLDVTKVDSIDEFMDKINQEEGGVDILVNNAGVGQAGIMEKVTESQMKTVYDTNVFGVIRMTQAVTPGMKAKRSGHIINVSSVGGLIGVPFYEICVSSKFAIEGFSESLAPVLKQFNVSVSLIEPGTVQTAFVTNVAANKTGSFSVDEEIDPDVDELTQKLLKGTRTSGVSRLTNYMQTGAEIAKVIQEVILSDKPHLHYITSEVYKKLLAAMKFVDVTGDSIVEGIIQQQHWET
ncbi:retinol dehydrogenase 8-like isoform X2 [Amphiura filiformis]|uniref:retinol dehydrogenase 8-like isoform X2 n=1 Tax=Amphiura filiformis TaxID=82378 RepID=UPI003B2171F6